MIHSIDFANMFQKDDADWTKEELKEILPTVFPLIWKHRDKILNDGRLFLTRIPQCIQQMVTFRIGGLINCWMKNEWFQMSPITEEAARNPMFVYNIGGSPMTGYCYVEAVNLLTGELYSIANNICMVDLMKKKPQYSIESFLAYVKNYSHFCESEKFENQGVQPASFSELLQKIAEWENADDKEAILPACVPNKAADYATFCAKVEAEKKAWSDAIKKEKKKEQAKRQDHIKRICHPYRDELLHIFATTERDPLSDAKRLKELEEKKTSLRKKLRHKEITREEFHREHTLLNREIFTLMSHANIKQDEAIEKALLRHGIREKINTYEVRVALYD